MGISAKIIQAAAGNAGAAVETDPNFPETTLLLQADDVNDGSQNNTFLDSSTNTHTITRNGNVTQGSFSPFSQDEGKWGNYFDGSGDYLQTDGSDDFGTGDFTVEAWVYPTIDSSSDRIIVDTRTSASDTGFVWFLNSAEQLSVYTSAGIRLTSSTSLPVNSWSHVVFTRESGTIEFFIDGVSDATASYSTTITSPNNYRIGARNDLSASVYFNGYMANLRIVTGTAVYTSNFTPSTTPLTAISGTSLLTCQSNRFVDNSSNAHSITVNGDPEVTPFSPFAPSTAYDPATKGGSGYFHGGGDYLQMADSDDFHIGASDFTIEGWIYKKDKGTWSSLIGQRQASNAEWRIILDIDNVATYTEGYFRLDWGSGVAVWTSANIPNNAWTHFALVRSGTTGTLYINGTSVGTNTLNDIGNLSAPLRIGTNDGSGEYYLGYISNLRLVKGTAIAPSGIPTAPLTEVSGTSLLCNFTNAGMYDGTGRNVLETVGDAQVDTAVFKYGTGSMKFDGTGDELLVPWSSIFEFGDGDFTIEGWVYPTNSSGGTVISWADGIASRMDIGWQDPATFRFLVDNPTTYTIEPTGTAVADYLNSWVHFALVRDSGVYELFFNGSSGGTITTSELMPNGTNTSVVIGVRSYNSSHRADTFFGYIDDLRITKGVARYTANFTPPEAKLPNL